MASFVNPGSFNQIQMPDPYLTNLLRGYKPQGFILDKLLLEVPTDIDFGRIPVVNAPLQIDGDLQLSPTGFSTITVEIKTDKSYSLENRGLQALLTSLDFQKFGGEARCKEIFNQLIDDKLMLGREYRFASVATDASVMTTNYTIPIPWSDFSDTAAQSILHDWVLMRSYTRKGTGIGASIGCGRMPNTAIVPLEVYNVLSNHPGLVKAYLAQVASASYNGVLSREQLAKLMQVETILVPEAMFDAAEQGQTRSLTDVWGNNVLFCYINPALKPNMAQQSLGYTFKPNSPAQGYPEFTFEWTPQGTLPQMGKYITRGRKYQDNLLDVNCATLAPNVL